MPSTFRLMTARAAHAFTLLSLFAASTMADPVPQVDSLDKRAAGTYVGCYSSSTPLTSQNTYMYQSSGYCAQHCSSEVIGLTAGNQCFCGDQIPATADKVDDSQCNQKCDGFGQEMCGGNGFWTVYVLSGNPTNYGGSSDSSSAPSNPTTTANQPSPTSASQTVITSEVSAGHTAVVTITAPASPSDVNNGADQPKKSSGGGSSNTAGIAAGVVVGVVALAAIIAGIFFFIRHKKRKEAEEEYKSRTQVSDFMRGTNERKAPGTSYSGYSDQRLDPEAGARRNSVGSLADNQDYSRRILRVANPDSS